MAIKKDPIVEMFEKKGITGVNPSISQQKLLCPQCSSKRQKKDEPCLSVNLDTGLFHCFNCGFKGGIKNGNSIKESYVVKNYTKPNYDSSDWKLTKEAIDYFKSRGISKQTLEINKVGSSVTKFSVKDKEDTLLLSFPFMKKDEIVNVKYRTIDKRMRSVKNAESCFYGIQNLFSDGYLATDKIYIVEGEIDLLSLYEVGFKYCLSVPSGANVEEEGSPKSTPKLDFLDDSDISDVLENIPEVVIVTDSDYKGKRLRDELALRIGMDKCFYVDFPSGCKDPNDVLVNHGSETLIECLLNVKPMLKGLVEVVDMDTNLIDFYKNGLKEGYKCGIEPFDEIFTLKEQLITLVTGVPESFKSTFIDNIALGYADLNDMHVAMFSPETKPTELHIGRLACIYSGKSLDEENDNYMDYEEFKDSCNWVNKHFSFIQPKANTLDEILTLAKVSVLRHGTKILVVDPYSRIKVESDIEHSYIKNMLNDLAEFAVKYGVHIFVVAHPVKMMPPTRSNANNTAPQNYPIVTPYHIKGASEWFNSADFILSLWKDRTQQNMPVQVHCLKSKYYHIAKSDKHCELDYDFSNYIFS